ncbi:DUF2269 family protein [Acidithiobacillus sp.]|uniref:DUF2269 family protein n=1 Tax=Acidithiobacillus sp. TaxID=1872118 RepID=UPI0032AF260F
MGNAFLLFKILHIFGVVIFLGNIIITGWWKVMADRTGNASVIAFAQRQVTLTDFVFTAGGATLLLAAGISDAAIAHMDIWGTSWLEWGSGLFIASGVIWVTVLIPLQIVQARMARRFAAGGAIPARYWLLGKLWVGFGTLATVLPLFNLYWMVVRPN